MKTCSPFYFLRHGETDHNVNQIYDDVTQIELNRTGIKQAENIQAKLVSIPIATVFCSPLLRAQQTKSIVLDNKQIQEITIDEFQECPGALWRLFLVWETRTLTTNEWNQIQKFIDRVRIGFEKMLTYSAPHLIIAHGGTYWALAHLLGLNGDRKVSNCDLIRLVPITERNWKAESVI
jgi:probable phosphoglycerate mutase